LIATGVLRRLLAFTELKFSDSMIEASWRFLKPPGTACAKTRTAHVEQTGEESVLVHLPNASRMCSVVCR
jgi:hypothetical protein